MQHSPIDSPETATTILNDEFAAAVSHPDTARALDAMWRVSPKAFRAVGWIGLSPIETRGQYFTPTDEGALAIVLPVFDGETHSKNLIDLACWYPDEPGKWWTRTGYAWALGEWRADFPWLLPQPTRFFRTPLEWLRAAGDGICPLDSGAENLLSQCGLIEVVTARDLAHGEYLERALTPPPIKSPRILVAETPNG